MNGLTVNGDENAEERAKLWAERFDAVLNMDLPFAKIGIAHLSCPLIYSGHYLDVLKAIPDSEYGRLFKKAAEIGVGIELNFNSLKMSNGEFEENLRMYRAAKAEGCKFYFGSDSHHPSGFENMKKNFEKIAEALELEETDKFMI